MTRISVLVLLCLVFTMTNAREVHADPQVLAAVPAGEPLEFVCSEATCEVELSTICLQPDRHLPSPGTTYKVIEGDLGSIAFSGRSADGGTVTLDSSLLKVESHRSQTAIHVSVGRKVLEHKGLLSASVDFDRPIALLPQPAQDGSVPQSPAEIAKAVDGIRRFGQIWADDNADNMTVARITVRMANRLPLSGFVPNTTSDQLLRRALGQETAISPRALESSRRLVALCQRRSQYTSMRKCLADFHDQIMRSLNGRYWSILDLGS